MLLSPSPRGSFSIPVHINLRRRRTREILQYTNAVSDSQRRRYRGGNAGGGGAEKAKAQVLVSSIGEERALFLGFVMMAFSIFMYFVVGIVMLKPCIRSDWGDATNCSLIQAEFLNESDDRGSAYPCLQVLVNATAAEKALHLRFDEAAVNLSPECFYTPKNHQNKMDMLEEAQRIKEYFCKLQGQAVPCHLSGSQYPEDAVLKKKHNLHVALRHLVWPSLMLFGGTMLVGLIMLTQYLAYLCNEIVQEEEAMEDVQSTSGQNKLYRFLPRRPWRPSMEGEDYGSD